MHVKDCQRSEVSLNFRHLCVWCTFSHTGSGLDLQSLCLVPGKTCWIVYVDALVLNDGGNVLDALSIAARAALALTRVYKVTTAAAPGQPCVLCTVLLQAVHHQA